jgi:polysaccharide export outer membrane protein
MAWPVDAILRKRPVILRRMPEIEVCYGTAIKPGVITRRLMKSISLLAVCALLSVFPALARMPMGVLLKPGDEVIIEMRNPPEDAPKPPATYVISEQGKLKLPMLQQAIPAAGVSLKTLTSNNNEAYKGSGIHPFPSVKTITLPLDFCCPHLVTIRGGVHKPGEYPLRQGMTLMGVIDRAGGLPYKVKKVKILRDKKELIYDLRKINPEGSNNPVLMDGDQIIVPGG